jgi:hypothetical protein
MALLPRRYENERRAAPLVCEFEAGRKNRSEKENLVPTKGVEPLTRRV